MAGVIGLVSNVTAAQTPDTTATSSISATVRDSLGLPVAGASVLITPGGYISRTDSAGKFRTHSIPAGAMTIAIRKFGFWPLQSQVTLQIGIDLALDLVMQRVPQMLAEVKVTANRQCERYSLDGILCRREQNYGGQFMDRAEILSKLKDTHFTMLLLRDMPGFRQNLNGSAKTVESTTGWRCYRRILDGGFPYSYDAVPNPKDVYAIEVYEPPNIPLEYQQWAWQSIRVTRRTTQMRPCKLIVMWSMTEAQRQLKRLANPPK